MSKNKHPDSIERASAYFLSKLNTVNNIADISRSMRMFKVTPYIFVHHSMKMLVKGDYKGSFKILRFAGKFEGIFYHRKTLENENYIKTIEIMQYMILHLSDEFGKCSSGISSAGENTDNITRG